MGNTGFDIPPGFGAAIASELASLNLDLQTHARNGAQRQADGAAALAEFTRLDYIDGKRRVDYAQATGIRHVEESGSGRVRNLDATVAGQAGSGK
jgi:hypothetical protein